MKVAHLVGDEVPQPLDMNAVDDFSGTPACIPLRQLPLWIVRESCDDVYMVAFTHQLFRESSCVWRDAGGFRSIVQAKDRDAKVR